MTPEAYENWYSTPRGRWIGEVERCMILRAIDACEGQSILDVGCGTGWFTRQFSNERKLRVTGLDSDPDRLAFARSRDTASTYIRGDALQLPFADNAVDHVVSMTALPFVSDWRRALGEIVRVSRGRFAVGLLNRNSRLWREKGQGEGTGAYRGAYWHTADELDAVLRQLAAQDVAMQSCITFSSGGVMARLAESVIPSSQLRGAFLVVSGVKR